MSSLAMLAPTSSAYYVGQHEQLGVYEANFGQYDQGSWDGWTAVNSTFGYPASTPKSVTATVGSTSYPNISPGHIEQNFTLGASYDIYIQIETSNSVKINDRYLFAVLSDDGQPAGPAVLIQKFDDVHHPVLYNAAGGAPQVITEVVIPSTGVASNVMPVLCEVRGQEITIHADGASVALTWTAGDVAPAKIRIGHYADHEGAAPTGYMVVAKVLVDTAPDRERWVAIGDSITASAYTPLNESYRYYLGDMLGAYVTNDGIGSQTSTQMRDRYARDVSGYRPDHVIIQAGTNDASTHTAEQTIANIDQMINWTLALDAEAWVLQVTPTGGSSTNPATLAHRQAVNSHIANLSLAGVHVVDTWTPLVGDNNDLRAGYDSGDGTHPNGAGNLVIAQAIYDVYLIAIEPTELEKSMAALESAIVFVAVVALLGGLVSMVGRMRY